jgi:hypothetical protein
LTDAVQDRRPVIELRGIVSVYRPMRVVFEYVSAPENDFQWQYGTLAAAALSAGPNRVGMQFRRIGHLLGRRVETIFEVTDYEPFGRYGYRSFSGPLESRTAFAFQTGRGVTQIEASMSASADLLLQLNERALEQELRRQQKEDLQLLKRLLEAAPTPASSVRGSVAGRMEE